MSDNTVINKTEWSAGGFKDSPANRDGDAKSVRDGKTPATRSIPTALLLEQPVLVCGLLLHQRNIKMTLELMFKSKIAPECCFKSIIHLYIHVCIVVTMSVTGHLH